MFWTTEGLFTDRCVETTTQNLHLQWACKNVQTITNQILMSRLPQCFALLNVDGKYLTALFHPGETIICWQSKPPGCSPLKFPSMPREHWVQEDIISLQFPLLLESRRRQSPNQIPTIPWVRRGPWHWFDAVMSIKQEAGKDICSPSGGIWSSFKNLTLDLKHQQTHISKQQSHQSKPQHQL